MCVCEEVMGVTLWGLHHNVAILKEASYLTRRRAAESGKNAILWK